MVYNIIYIIYFSLSIYIYMYTCIHTYIYIYIYNKLVSRLRSCRFAGIHFQNIVFFVWYSTYIVCHMFVTLFSYDFHIFWKCFFFLSSIPKWYYKARVNTRAPTGGCNTVQANDKKSPRFGQALKFLNNIRQSFNTGIIGKYYRKIL